MLTVAPEPALATVAAAAIRFLRECVKALARLFVTKAFSSKTGKMEERERKEQRENKIDRYRLEN